MRITIHLSFPGTCEAAFAFYRDCLGGEITTMLPWADSPLAETVPYNWRSKICHASLSAGSTSLAGSDIPPEEYRHIQGVQMLLDAKSTASAKRIFSALATDGMIVAPLQRTFWSECYGIVQDPFGIQWEIQFSS